MFVMDIIKYSKNGREKMSINLVYFYLPIFPNFSVYLINYSPFII